MTETIIGYKVTFKDHEGNYYCQPRCDKFIYNVGKPTNNTTQELDICVSGLHFCRELADIWHYYGSADNIYLFKVTAGPNVMHEGDKSAATSLTLEHLLEGTFESKGHTYHFKGGQLHSDGDKPAITGYGTWGWYKNGELHRDGDKPAYIGADGTQEWYVDGEQHRDGDQPAHIGADGMRWYKDGKLHRDGDNPASIDADGTRRWYKDGQLYRDGDKPAIMWGAGRWKVTRNFFEQ